MRRTPLQEGSAPRRNVLRMGVRRLTMDLAARTLTVELLDGTAVTAPSGRDLLRRGVQITRASFDLLERELKVTLPGGDTVTFEVGSETSDAPPSVRRIVYLDQVHWIRLAQLRTSPGKISEGERAAAAELVELAHAKTIILPLSSGHLTETAPEGRWRRHLASTMLELSRGWQMRNPVRVRRRELAAALGGARPAATDVFTLEPDVLFVEPTGGPISTFPPGWRELHHRLTSVSAICDVMVADDRSPRADAREKASRWAAVHADLGRHLHENRVGERQARLTVRAALLADLRDEVASAAVIAGRQASHLAVWLAQLKEDGFHPFPCLGLLERMVFQRLRNAQDRWEANDLVDMHFLACAGGYADVVVGERKAADQLRRASRHTASGAYVSPTLAEAVAHLRQTA
jgi:hypothetical protein